MSANTTILVSGLFAVLCLSSRAAGPSAEFLAETRAAAVDVKALDAVWYGSLGRLAKQGGAKSPVLVVRATLSGVIQRKPASIEIIFINGKPFAGKMWAPEWNTAIHRVDPAGLTLSGTPAKGKLGGSVSVVFMPDHRVPFEGKPLSARLNVNAQVAKGKATGKFSASGAIPKSSGNLDGTVQAASETKTPPADLPVADLSKLNPYDLYATAVRLEREALEKYRQIRVFEAVGRTGGDVTSVLKGMSVPVPVRPAFTVAAPKKPKTGKKPPTGPAIDDLDDDLDLDLGDEGPAAKAAPPKKVVDISRDPNARKRLGTLRDIRRHIGLMRVAAEGHHANGGKADVAGPGATFDDPHFGPWYGWVPLPKKGPRPQIIPADAGGDGPQHWPYVNCWHYLGPLPRRLVSVMAPCLPEIFPTKDATYGEISQSIRQQQYVGPGTLRWTARNVNEKGNGIWRPPQWCAARKGFNSAHNGIPNGTVYAAAEIYSEKDVELWGAASVDNEGKLWLNNRLAAAWNVPKDARQLDRTKVFRLRFKRGPNVMVARADKTGGDTGFFVRICLRGRPRDKATAVAQIAAVEKAIDRVKHVPDHVRGWRGNWNGEFPGTKPVTAWDLDKGINVLWQTPLPKGCAHAVVTGDRIITLYEKNSIACLDRKTGDVLWDRELNILELTDKKLHEEAKKKRSAWKKAWNDIVRLGRTWGEQIESLKKQKNLDDEKAKEELLRLRKESHNRHGEYWRFVYTNGKCQERSSWKDWWGLMYATPITDGKHVWVKCAAGVTACFDLDGNRKWMVKTDYPERCESLCSSPVLTGNPYDGTGRLIMEIPAAKQVHWEGTPLKMIGLDAMTGKKMWEVPYSCNPQGASSPVPMRLTNGKEEMEVVITGGGGLSELREGEPSDFRYEGGTVVRAIDGKVLIHSMGTVPWWGSPTRIRNKVFHVSNMATGHEMIMVNRDVVGAKRMWARKLAGFDAGLVHYDGFLHGQAGGQWFCGYYIYDPETGHEVPRQANVGWGFNGGRTYCPPAVSDGLLFMADHGTALGKRFPKANLTVMQTGPRGRIIARNGLPEPFSGGPVFDGDMSFYRTEPAMVCIGYTGEEGRAYEAEKNARELFRDFVTEPPPRVAARKLVPRKSGPRREEPSQALAGKIWKPMATLGPVPLADADELLKALGGPGGVRLWKDREVKVNGKAYKAAMADDRFLHIRKVLEGLQGKSNVTQLFYCLLRNPRDWTVRMHMNIPAADVWLAGEPIKNMDRLELKKGHYPLVIRLRIGEKSPGSLGLGMHVVDSGGMRDVAGWHADVKRNRGIFERIIKYKPDSDLARKAKVILAHAK